MNKKICFGLIIVIIIISLGAYISSQKSETDSNIEKENTTSTTQTTESGSYSTTTSSKSSYSSKITHYCDADGCYREGTKSYVGITGQTEYYCYTHYNEIIDILSSMEEDVGGSTYNKHTCEECSREGTYSIIGFSGSTEYYCSKHYNEMKEMLEMFQ